MADEIGHQITTSSGQLASFVGSFNPDINIVSAGALFDGSQFVFEADLAGALGTTSGAAYVFGVNRGENLAPFAPFMIGEGNVLFDTVVILQDTGGAGTGFVFDLLANTTTPLPAGDVTINGDTITGVVPGADLPSIGLFSQSQFQVNLWTRVGLDAADKTQLADFAPNNMDAPIATPEPGSVSLLGLGLAALWMLPRRRSA
jgi:hypothetical protein